MTSEERTLIDGLFDRLRQADTSPKDQEALQLINSRVAAQPTAPYLLVQAILVQEHALANAQARIADLERQLAARTQPAQASGGSFLSGVTQFFTGKTPSQSSPVPPPLPQQPQQTPAQYQPVNVPTQSVPPPVNYPYPSTVNLPPNSGGGFLKTALTTAAGVAGGAVLFQGIENLIGHRAGPFESMIQPSGFTPQTPFGEGGGNTEIVNNYYETPAPDQRTVSDQSFESNDPNLAQDTGFDPGDTSSDFTDVSDFGNDDTNQSDNV